MTSLLLHRHSAEGYISIAYSPDSVHFECRWPLDLETDEWLTINENYPLEAYSQAIRELTDGGTAELSGDYCSVSMRRRSSDEISLRLTKSGGAIPRTLILTVDKSPESLAVDGSGDDTD